MPPDPAGLEGAMAARGDGSVARRNREAFGGCLAGADPETGLRKARRIAAVLGRVAPRQVVGDVGCHDGLYTALYAAVPGVEAVEGFDVAEAVLGAVRARGFRAWTWVGGSEASPAPSGRYDVLVAGDVIEHVVDTEYFLAELRRMLRPGGHLIVTTPNLYYWLSRLKFLFARTPWSYPGVSSCFKADRNINTEHIRVNGQREWAAFFRARGFEVREMLGLDWVPPSGLKRRLIHWVDRLAPRGAACLSLFLLRKTPPEPGAERPPREGAP